MRYLNLQSLSMKNLLMTVASIILLFPHICAIAVCAGDNTKPMFGYDENHVVNECDQAFLTDVMKEAKGDKKYAVQGVLDIGHKAMKSGDYTKAIRRFNQAWLIDRNSPEVFKAFAEFEKAAERLDKSKEFLKRAKELETKKNR